MGEGPPGFPAAQEWRGPSPGQGSGAAARRLGLVFLPSIRAAGPVPACGLGSPGCAVTAGAAARGGRELRAAALGLARLGPAWPRLPHPGRPRRLLGTVLCEAECCGDSQLCVHVCSRRQTPPLLCLLTSAS